MADSWPTPHVPIMWRKVCAATKASWISFSVDCRSVLLQLHRLHCPDTLALKIQQTFICSYSQCESVARMRGGRLSSRIFPVVKIFNFIYVCWGFQHLPSIPGLYFFYHKNILPNHKELHDWDGTLPNLKLLYFDATEGTHNQFRAREVKTDLPPSK